MKKTFPRPLLAICALALIGLRSVASEAPEDPALPIAAGPFKPTMESLSQYAYPEWFRDAKFGIWAHWGPQAVPRMGDWYAKKLYESDEWDNKTKKTTGPSEDYKDHLKRFGHPSEFGYKDIIPLWKAERWDPEQLMALYKKAGARYFVSMGSHHDNFFLWDSKIHRWNSVNMGPKKDVVGLWQKAARKEGLRFGVSEHLAASFTWFQTSRGSDPDGPKKGVPYDGNDPANEDLYHKKAEPGDTAWLTTNKEYHREWFNNVRELIDLYQPDLLYSDSGLPFDGVGQSMLAHYYNQSAAANGGKVDVVYNCKQDTEGRWVRDIERGVSDGIRKDPWQTDTSIGDWYYRTGQQYKTAGEVIRMLVDIVSKNGNLLINVVQTPEGDLEPDVLNILEGISTWTAANGSGIYGTRPWKVYGEGPSLTQANEKGQFGGLRDVPTKPFTAQDFRFTMSKDGNTVFAFCFAEPEKEFRIVSLGTASQTAREIVDVEVLGAGKPEWKQEAGALVISKPSGIPSKEAIGIRISFKK